MLSHQYYSVCFKTTKTESQKDQELQSHQQFKHLITTLPGVTGWGRTLRCYDNFWFPEDILLGILSIRQNFHPSPNSDILLVTYPKSGTTWLKALAFAISDRPSDSDFSHHPLLTRHPQDCSPYLEAMFATAKVPDLTVLPSPRFLNTHIPFSLLPDSVKNSDCRIVYLCREPKDTLVSMWHFAKGMTPPGVEPVQFDRAFELFCDGLSAYGPVWDHQLEYWRESQARPEKVMFLKYEEMMEDPGRSVRMLAEFSGQPLTAEEERRGVAEEIVRMCSIENLKGLDVNKVGVKGEELNWNIKNSSFFRKGKVGDWREHLNSEMAGRMDRVTDQKLSGSGLSFRQLNTAQEG